MALKLDGAYEKLEAQKAGVVYAEAELKEIEKQIEARILTKHTPDMVRRAKVDCANQQVDKPRLIKSV